MNTNYNILPLKERRRELRKRETKAEKVLWKYLRNKQLGVKFYRQYGVGGYILDFYCPHVRIAIELDGEYHTNTEIKLNDAVRTKLLLSQGIAVLRFWNTEIFNSPEIVLKKIKKTINVPPSWDKRGLGGVPF